MNDKPKFWDFYRANRLSKFYGEDELYVYDRKKGKRALYNKLPLKTRYKYQYIGAGIMLALCAIIIIPWFIYQDRVLFLSSSLPEFLLIIYFATQFIGNIIINKLLYARMDFEKISEIDWDDKKESAYRRSRFWQMRFPWLLTAGIYLFMFLYMGFTPVYVRYLVDSASGSPWQASVRISTPEDNSIYLDSETQPGDVFTLEGFDNNDKASISIWTLSIPEQVRLFINGEAVDYGQDVYMSGYAGRFWENHYFSIHINDEIHLNVHEGENTLELRSANFDREWTFTLEYE